MKIIFLSILSATWFLSACQTPVSPSDFKKMEWLIGTWKSEANEYQQQRGLGTLLLRRKKF
jgi:hypothetical protein